MRRLFLLIMSVLIGLIAAEAQTSYSLSTAYDFYHAHKIANGEYRNVLTENDIEGSPYLNDEFIKGSIYTSSKTQYADIPLRYNIYNDEIEFETEDKKVAAIASPEIVEKVTFGDITMEYIPFDYSKTVRKGFFKVIVKGRASLYARPDIEFREAKSPEPYKEAEPAKFIQKDDRYYLRLGMESAVMCVNKKDVISFFPDHSSEIDSFIKENKINVKKEDELKKLLEYYNSL